MTLTPEQMTDEQWMEEAERLADEMVGAAVRESIESCRGGFARAKFALLAHVRIRAAGGAPAGWRLVPEKPTRKMLRAMAAATFLDDRSNLEMERRYNGMLAAAPSTPAPAGQPMVTEINSRSCEYNGGTCTRRGCAGNCQAMVLANDFSDRHLRAEHEAAPAGFKLVPIEPTPQMRKAGKDTGAGFGFVDAYRAMVAAAPQPAHRESEPKTNGGQASEGGQR